VLAFFLAFVAQGLPKQLPQTLPTAHEVSDAAAIKQFATMERTDVTKTVDPEEQRS
jgi:hypothetical protein